MNNKNILFIFVLIICLICLFLGIFNVCAPKAEKSLEIKKSKTKADKFVSQTGKKAAIILIDGVISSDSKKGGILSEENSSKIALEALEKVKDDNNIKGVILRINSPGGTVGMSQMIYNAVIALRKEKPVVALMDDIAASGGYYIASAADRIVCLPGTMTGSIGVIMSSMDLHEFLNEKLSINENVIKSGRYKDIGSKTRKMTADEKKLLQDIVDDSYAQFKEAIINGRVNRGNDYGVEKKVLTLQTLDKYADGRVFTGRQALQYGFADSVGGMSAAKEMLNKMAAEKFNEAKTDGYDLDYFEYTAPVDFWSIFGELVSNGQFAKDFLPKSMQYAGRPLYLLE